MAPSGPDGRHAGELTDEELARLVNEALNPWWNRPQPPSRSAATEIVRRARQRRRRRRGPARAVGLTVLTAAAVVVVVAAVMVLTATLGLHPDQTISGPPPSLPAVTPSPVTLPERGKWKPARTPLTELADKVRGQGGQGSSGRYAYTRVRGWSVDMTAAEPQRATTVRDEQRWWDAGRSGRQVTSTVSGWIPGMAVGAAPSPGPGGDRRYGSRQFPVVISKLADNVFVLSSQLAGQEDFSTGPQAVLRAVREVYRFHCPTAAQRANLLQVLADTDGLSYAGPVDAGPGRRGVAVVVDSNRGATRDVAIFDPDTGWLRAYETVVLRNPTGLHLPTPALADALLFLGAARTDRLDQPPAN